nr:hypothetical protein Iba_chr12aCG10120 [Ipomoea batatas]
MSATVNEEFAVARWRPCWFATAVARCEEAAPSKLIVSVTCCCCEICCNIEMGQTIETLRDVRSASVCSPQETVRSPLFLVLDCTSLFTIAADDGRSSDGGETVNL